MPSPDIRPVERLLIVRCGALGDMVLLTALIRELHALWQCPIDIVTSGAWSEPLLRGQPGVGDIYTLRSRKTPYWLGPDQWRLVRALRARGAQPTWFCDGGEAGKSLLARSGLAPSCIVDVNDHPLKPGEHATAQWRRLAQIRPTAWSALALPGALSDEYGCHLEVSEAQRADVAQWLEGRGLAGRPLILVQAGNKRTMRRGLRRLAINHKYWPPQRWADVLAHVHKRCPEHLILLLGTQRESAHNREIMAVSGVAGLHDVADDLPVPRLVALLERACALISVDSGPAHIGAAVGCPQVVLFGRASPALYRPLGVAAAQVEVLQGEQDGAPSMLGIETGAVTAAWDRLVRRSP